MTRPKTLVVKTLVALIVAGVVLLRRGGMETVLTLKIAEFFLSLLGIILLFTSAIVVVFNLQDMLSPTTFMVVVVLGSVGYAMYIGHIIVSFVAFLVGDHME